MGYSALIVDDEDIIANGIKKCVNWNKFKINKVNTCNNGKQAFEFINDNDVDILITDIRMPGIDGINLIKNIRATGYDNIEILLLTAYKDFNYAKEAIKYNVIDYLVKPTTPDEIEKIIEKMMQKIKARSVKYSFTMDEKNDYEDINVHNKHKRLCDNIIKYLEENYDKEITLNIIASNFYLSSNYIGKIFKDVVNKSYKEILVDIRINRAKELIKTGEYKNLEVADMVGYKNYENFRQGFKKITGINPSEY
ncbi:MAG: response regulator transcription factor [Clostridium sp.]|uniref:response regulator transcription factor n=1 Tax=Clostridium sp. TaxID=1506 RepID=UPI003D6D0470